jgi:hypothetical protein
MKPLTVPANPNPSLYAMSETGYVLKPKQCVFCKQLFTPQKEYERSCNCFLPGKTEQEKTHIILCRIDYSKKNNNTALEKYWTNMYEKIIGKYIRTSTKKEI